MTTIHSIYPYLFICLFIIFIASSSNPFDHLMVMLSFILKMGPSSLPEQLEAVTCCILNLLAMGLMP